jgi:hypothetical protein
LFFSMSTKTSAHKTIRTLRSGHPGVHICRTVNGPDGSCQPGRPWFANFPPSASYSYGWIRDHRVPSTLPAITSELLLIFVLIANQCPVNFSHFSSINCPSPSNIMQCDAHFHICSPSRHHASRRSAKPDAADRPQDRLSNLLRLP